MELSLYEGYKVKQCPVDTWTTREHLCLSSAVSQTGDQNWAVVSKVIKHITTETDRPSDWYSTKNCALQYARLLEQVDVPKRKREKGDGSPPETPEQYLMKMLSKRRVEELKGILEEERATYNQLRKEILHLESNQLDNRLHQYWDEMMREQEMEEEEATKLQKRLKEREEKIRAYQAASKFQGMKSNTPLSPKKPLNPPKVSTTQIPKGATVSENEKAESVCEKSDSLEKTESKPAIVTNVSEPQHSSVSNLNIVSTYTSSNCTPKTEKVEETHIIEKDFHPQVKDDDEDDVKLPEDGFENIKCETSFETNLPLDYTSNLEKEDEEKDTTNDNERKPTPPSAAEEVEAVEEKELEEYKKPSDTKQEFDDEVLKEPEEQIKVKESNDVIEREIEENPKESQTEEEPPIEEKLTETEEPEKEVEEPTKNEDEENKVIKKKKVLGTSSSKDETVVSKSSEEELRTETKKEEEEKLVVTETKKSNSLSEVAAKLTVAESPVEKEVEKKPVKKEVKDEYEFDDDASRESTDVKDYMNRSERRKFSLSENVSSPVVSESTPSSPASTSYGDDPEAEKSHRSWKRSIMLIWNDIAAHKNASLFLKPITEDKVPGYHSIVYRPLDLMTIKRNIESGNIRTTTDFQRDIMLMFMNAKMYNTRDNNIYRMADHMMNDALETLEEFIHAQMLAKVVETPQKSLRRETRESSAKRVGEDMKRKRDERDDKLLKRRKL